MVEIETREESQMDSKRFRRSERLQSILGKLRESRDEEWKLAGLPAVKTSASPKNRHEQNHNDGVRVDSVDYASLASKQDQARIPPAEARTEDILYENQRFVVDNEPREGPTNVDRNGPEGQEEASSRDDLIRQRINAAVMDSMTSSDGADNKRTTFSVLDKKATIQAMAQGSASKANLKVTIGDTVVEGSRIASPKSPQKRTSSRTGISSPRGGRMTSPRNTVSMFFDPNSDTSESESSANQASFTRRKSPRAAKRSPRINATKVPSKSLAVQSKSISSDDSERDSITSSDSSGSDYTSTSSENGYSTGSSLKHSTKRLTIDTKDQLGDEPKGTTTSENKKYSRR
jgi:hypothetical protein